MQELLTDRLREYRKATGKTQVQMAELIDISQVNYAKYERGHKTPSLLTFIKLAIALDQPAECLISEEKGEKILAPEQFAKLATLSDRKLKTILHSLQAMYESQDKE